MKPDSTKIDTLKLPADWDALFAEERPANAYTVVELYAKLNDGQKLKSFTGALNEKVRAGQVERIKGKLNHHLINFYRLKPHQKPH